MPSIKLHMTETKARRYERECRSAGLTDLADVFAAHLREIPPWRNVVETSTIRSLRVDVLECGHTWEGGSGGRSTTLPPEAAKRRRCPDCVKGEGK